MVPQLSREYKVSSIILVILILLFGISLAEVAKQLPNSHPASFMNWIVLGVHILVLGKLIGALSPKYKETVKRITLGLTVIALYISLSTGLLHYQGEGGSRFAGRSPHPGEDIDYYVDLHDGLNLPLTVDLVIPINKRGLKQEIISVKSDDKNEFIVGLRYKVSQNSPILPDKLVVVYRAFYVIPMVEVIWLNWPGFS